MAEVTWGELAKTVSDKTKISEEIDADLLAHNEDPSAHRQTDEAIDTHRVAEILDHLDGSISFIKFSATKYLYITHFESLDGWPERAGSITLAAYGVSIQAAAVLNAYGYLLGEAIGGGPMIDVTKNPFFQTTVELVNTTNQIVYWKTGYLDESDYDDGFGFKVVNNTLYALHIRTVAGSPVEYTTQISGITLIDRNIYRGVFDSDSSEIKFYVNGVLKATHSSNLPLTPPADPLFVFQIQAKEAAVKTFRILDLIVAVDR